MSGNSYIPNKKDHHTGKGVSLSLIAAGGAVGLGLYALARRKKAGEALTATGLYAIKKAGKLHSSSSYKAHASFAISCSPEKAYGFWHDFENLPRFMRHIEAVRRVDSNRLEWTALGPMEARIHWSAEIVEDQENQRISWRSLPGSEVSNHGSIEFRSRPDGRGTQVTATMEYLQPAGKLGKALISMLGKDPQFTMREDLRRFKSLLETGEVPTTLGQPHGPRGMHGQGLQVLLREKQNLPAPPLHPQVSRTA